MRAIDQLKSVLCDPDGKCCIASSEEDRAIVDRALETLAQPQVQEAVKGENELIWLIEALNKHCGSGFIPHDIKDAFAAYQIATKGTV